MLKPRDNISVGAVFKNLAGSVNWKNGSSENLESKTGLGGAIKLLDNKLLVGLDLDFALNSKAPVLFHTGCEWRPVTMIAVRAGIDQSALNASSAATNLCAGLGLRLAGFAFDYAYRQDSQLSNNSTHYISLSFKPVVSTTKLVRKSTKKVAKIVNSKPTLVAKKKTKSTIKTVKVKKDVDILSYYK